MALGVLSYVMKGRSQEILGLVPMSVLEWAENRGCIPVNIEPAVSVGDSTTLLSLLGTFYCDSVEFVMKLSEVVVI